MSAVLVEQGIDTGAVWHYGDPLREQKQLEAGEASVDLRHRPVLAITGRDRLSWLNSLATQKFEGLAPGVWVTSYVLDFSGRIQQVFGGADDGETFWATTEPGHLDELLAHLDRMRFAAKVSVRDASSERAMIIAGGPRIVERDAVEDALGAVRAGTWAAEALRIAAGQPRVFLDTDERTLPNEVGMPDGDALGVGVHLHKGCYCGQETVARVYNTGRPPRRLTLLHLDGTTNDLPSVGSDVMLDGQVVGRVGTSGVHYDLGPIALALVKRETPTDAVLAVGEDAETSASQGIVVEPSVGLHAGEDFAELKAARRRLK